MCSMELPAVIVDVMRYGIGLGSIMLGQGDYFQAVKGGGHGGYKVPVYAPASVQENVDFTIKAFDTAEDYRTPALILSDGAIGQMAESVELPEGREHDPDKYDWTLKGRDAAHPTGRKMTTGSITISSSMNTTRIFANVMQRWRMNFRCGRKQRRMTQRLFW